MIFKGMDQRRVLANLRVVAMLLNKRLIGLDTDRNASTDQQFSTSRKEALESDPVDRSFRTHFLSRIEEGQALSQSEQAQLAKIDRKTPISKVPKEWQMPFAIARGCAIIEKVKCLLDEDINTEKEFYSRYQIGIYERGVGVFEVQTSVNAKYPVIYENDIDIKAGRIIAISNRRDLDAKKKGNGKPLPNSEILYNQLLAVLRDQRIDLSRFNLTQVKRSKIVNRETCDTLNLCIKNVGKSLSVHKHLFQFGKGSEEYYAILGTPNAYGILYLLKQHPGVFGKKEITCIEVEKYVSGTPNIIFHIN